MNDPSASAGEVWSGLIGPGGQGAAWRMPIEENLRWAAQRAALFREAVAKVAFPLYGMPPDWPGRRFLGGGRRSWPDGMDRDRDPGFLHSLGLVHGTNVQGEGPMLVVETARPDADSGRGPLRVAAARLWAGRVITEDEPSRRIDPELRPVRSSAEIHVEGQPVLLDVVASEDNNAWVGRAHLPACRLTVEAQEFPVDDIELVRVLDVAPYPSP